MSASLITLLLSALSQAVLAVFAKLISKAMFEKLLEKIIITGVNQLAEKTNSKLLDDIAVIVKAELEKGAPTK